MCDNENWNDKMPPFLVDNALEIERCMVCSNKESMLQPVSMPHKFIQSNVHEVLVEVRVLENNVLNSCIPVAPLQTTMHEETQKFINSKGVTSNKSIDKPYSESSLCKEYASCEELESEEYEIGCDEIFYPDDFDDCFKSDLEIFVTSEYEGDFLSDVISADIEYESVEFIDIIQGCEVDEEDCFLVTPHDTLKSDLELFGVHKDSFVEKVNDDAFSSYSDLSM